MPLPAPLLLGGAALLLYLMSQGSKGSGSGPTLPGGSKDSDLKSWAACLDPSMSQAARSEISNLLKQALDDPSFDPAVLDAAAESASSSGYPLAAACLRKLANSRRSTNPPTPEEIPPGGVEDWPYAACLDDAMPPTQKAQVNALLSNATDPAALDAAAKLAADSGYPLAAACLKAAADLVRGGETPGGETPVPVPPLGPMPFTIRYGDAPYALAAYYTGQGSRYPELASQNSNLGPLVQRPLNDGSGKTYQAYKNWQPSLKIKLPLSWDPWTRPLPKPGSQSPSTTMPVPGVGA